jgi:hypothetical protein
MIDLDVFPIVIILLAYSLDLMQQRRNWLKPLQYLQDCLSKMAKWGRKCIIIL